MEEIIKNKKIEREKYSIENLGVYCKTIFKKGSFSQFDVKQYMDDSDIITNYTTMPFLWVDLNKPILIDKSARDYIRNGESINFTNDIYIITHNYINTFIIKILYNIYFKRYNLKIKLLNSETEAIELINSTHLKEV